MKIERLKKNHRKEILIGGLVVLGIVSAITFVTTKAKYKLAESIPLVSGTINYKPYDFKVMAMYQQNDSGTYTEINEMPSEGYIVNEEKTYCTTDNKTKVKGKIKTIDGNVAISNLNKNDKCYVWFDKELSPSEKTLAKLNITNPNTTTPDFSKIATTDEGVFKVADGMYGGYSYYWRGAVTNNYVKFADKCWRIVRINGDGSIRLIYDGTTCHPNGTNADSIVKTSVAYNTSFNNSSYVGWTYTASSQRPNGSGTASNAKKQLESWYNSNITGTNATKVADGKYCNDRNVPSGYTWNATGSTFFYAAFNRIITDYQPTLSCPSGDAYILSVGLITVDEAMYAGGRDKDNTLYYLYNGQNYWTMSPYIWHNENIAAGVFFVRYGSCLHWGYTDNTNVGLRPVINLKPDITFSDGNGTQSNPYIVQ